MSARKNKYNYTGQKSDFIYFQSSLLYRSYWEFKFHILLVILITFKYVITHSTDINIPSNLHACGGFFLAFFTCMCVIALHKTIESTSNTHKTTSWL